MKIEVEKEINERNELIFNIKLTMPNEYDPLKSKYSIDDTIKAPHEQEGDFEEEDLNPLEIVSEAAADMKDLLSAE